MPFEWNTVNIATVTSAVVLVIIVITLVLVNRNASMRGASCDKAAEFLGVNEALKGNANPKQSHNATLQLSVVKMNWCPACKALTPVIKQLQQAGTIVKIIDGPALGMEWHRKNNVQAYPTVCLTRPDQNQNAVPEVVKFYRGPRTVEGIAMFAKSTA